jgi:flavin reductase (DIM6/NTAB) family NADH-FMN oxidoreductase RutF
MTIHSGHPFVEPEPERDPVRRLRGRLGGTVSVWTAGSGGGRAGLTVSSVMVSGGDPGHALALVDPDSDLAEVVRDTGAAVVQLLEWRHRDLAEAFAGQAPAPGGVFRLGSWTGTEWGPRLEGVSAWAGVRLAGTPVEVGWSLLLDTVIEHVELGEEQEPLVHRRGRYVRPGPPR